MQPRRIRRAPRVHARVRMREAFCPPKPLLVGLGMIPRGEVGIVVADQSLHIPAIPNSYYSIGITMAALTTLIGPLLLRMVIRPKRNGSHGNVEMPTPLESTVPDAQEL